MFVCVFRRVLIRHREKCFQLSVVFERQLRCFGIRRYSNFFYFRGPFDEVFLITICPQFLVSNHARCCFGFDGSWNVLFNLHYRRTMRK